MEPGIVGADRVFGDIDFSIEFIDGRRVFGQIVQAKIDVYVNPPIEKTLWKPFDLLERKPLNVAGVLIVDFGAEFSGRRQHWRLHPRLVWVRHIHHGELPGGLWIHCGIRERDRGAGVVTRDVDLVVAEMSDQRIDVFGHSLRVVPIFRFGRQAHAAHVDADHMKLLREGWHDLVVFPPCLGPSWQKYQGPALASLHVVQTNAVNTRGSTLLVRVEDVVLRLHFHMARESAV